MSEHEQILREAIEALYRLGRKSYVDKDGVLHWELTADHWIAVNAEAALDALAALRPAVSEYKLPELPEPEEVSCDGPYCVYKTYTADQWLAAHRQGWDERGDAPDKQAGQAEPVAWQYRYKFPLEDGSMCEWNESDGEADAREWLAKGRYEIRALYTAPPRARVTLVEAAAPELLEALRKLADIADHAAHITNTSMMDDAITVSRAAIAKATGASHD